MCTNADSDTSPELLLPRLENKSMTSEKKRATDFCSKRKVGLFDGLMEYASVIDRQTDRVLAEIGLSALDFEIMVVLLAGEERSVTYLARAVSGHVGQVSRRVSRLVDNGLISRRRPRSDRRVVLLKLTEKGMKIELELDQRIGEFKRVLADGISREEMETFEAVIRKMLDNCDNLLRD